MTVAPPGDLFDGRFRTADIDAGGIRIHLTTGGTGAPLLLLHGYPQTHVMWHAVADRLADRFQLVMPDLRGYGDSGKPPGGAGSEAYSKRSMAADMAAVMSALGHHRFALAGHDRGGRVGHRLALDCPARVTALAVLDIVPTWHMFMHADRKFGQGYYHWFFLAQPAGLPEKLIGADPGFYLRHKLGQWSGEDARFHPAALAEYERCFADPATIAATCEDYRAAAGIDLRHDGADRHRRLDCPVLALWGSQGFVNRSYDVRAVWSQYARQVTGAALPCGHFLAEECPDRTAAALAGFFDGRE